jgi:predicted component of type VI protein secretion system
MAETQNESALGAVTFEGSDLASLLQKEFKPKTDEAKSAVEQAVQTLAQQALSNVSSCMKSTRRLIKVASHPPKGIDQWLHGNRKLFGGRYRTHRLKLET